MPSKLNQASPWASYPELVKHVVELPNIQLRGLMAIPKPNQDPEQQRQAYRQLADALKQLQEKLAPHSIHYRWVCRQIWDSAIAEGATILRIGTALFGPRNR